MPVYEYVCRTCDSRFEARRTMSEAGDPISCPDGHPDTARLLSVFASVGRAPAGASGPMPMGGRRPVAAAPDAAAPTSPGCAH